MAQKLVVDICDEYLRTQKSGTEEFALLVIQTYLALSKKQGITFPQKRLQEVYSVLYVEIQEVLRIRTYGMI